MALNLERCAERYPRAVDVSAALTLFGFAVLGGVLSVPGAGPPYALTPVAVLVGVSCLALPAHRRHPRTTVAVTVACATAAGAPGYLLNGRTGCVFLFAGVVLVVATEVIIDPGDDPLILRTLAPAFWLMLPVAAGTATPLRQACLEAAQARAEHVGRSREEEARLRVGDERTCIPRDLHDVVAHHLVLAQAGTAAHLSRTRPDRVETILTGLTDTTAEAPREPKATVGLLRRTCDDDALRQPAPGLARLPEPTTACQAAGIEVTVCTEGLGFLPHAAAKEAHVRLSYSRDRLTVTVTDDGTGVAAPTAPGAARGNGLIDMRERAHCVGGDLVAGHRPEGGFRVTTTLPLCPQSPEPEDLSA